MGKCKHPSYPTAISARRAVEAAKPVKLKAVRCESCRRYRLEAA